MNTLGAVALALALTGAPTSVAAAEDELSVLSDAMDFAMHDATFTMYHEIGHMLVSELGLPVLGKEEDAVDALATIWLLTDDSDPDSYNALIDAADGWYFNAVASTGAGVDDFSYYSDHSLDIQRAYAMVCMMVGKDAEVFGETADIYEIDADRQEACAYTYQQASAAWDSLLAPYTESDEYGAPIEIIYEDAGDYAEFAEEFMARGIMEHAAELVMENYALPQPVTFRATQCGEANAFFDPNESEVIYCYELAEYMFTMSVYDIAGWGDTAE
ncbi:MAG: hypothetical protein KIS86_12125 [Devosia sp.]|nr:hypothetical protein [Devosia sp.]